VPKIVGLETFSNEFVCFVRLTDDDGMIGWGQTAPYNADITAQVFHRQIVPWALGHDSQNIARLVDLIQRREQKFPGSYRARAIGGLDTALWDLAGRRANKPVVSLIGGTPGRLRAYASSMKRDISPADEASRLARLCDTYGFDAVKFRIGAECGNDIDEWPGRTEDIIQTVSSHLRGQADLLVDANSAFGVERAIAIGHMLQDHGVTHYEEPVPFWDLDATRTVTHALDIDVSGGEQDWDIATWKRMIDIRAVDIIQPDIMYMGGISRTLDVANMAAAHDIPCTLHSANLSLVTLCSMHVMKAIPNAGKYLEYSIEGDDYYPWQRNLFVQDPFTVTDGHVTISDAPGWGVDINPAWLDQATYVKADLDDWQPSAYAALYDMDKPR
jgi:L-alanine-DL-glutamate epimerase-like enolase superfamily enzyme